MVDKTYYYNDEAQLTYKEQDGLIAFLLILRITIAIIKLLHILVNTCH